MERNRIGEIRVLDNYSFVQFYSEDCDTVIKTLDGYTYRGRKLTVSYSKKKSEMTDDYESAQNDSLADNDSAEAARYEPAESNGGNSEFLV